MHKLRLLVLALFVALAGSGAGALASPKSQQPPSSSEIPTETLSSWIGKPRSEIKQRFGEPQPSSDRAGSWQVPLRTPQGTHPLGVFFEGDKVSAFEIKYEPALVATQAIPSDLRLTELPSADGGDVISPIRQLAHPATGRVWDLLPNSKVIRLTVTRPWKAKAGSQAATVQALLKKPFPSLPKAVRAEAKK